MINLELLAASNVQNVGSTHDVFSPVDPQLYSSIPSLDDRCMASQNRLLLLSTHEQTDGLPFKKP